MYIAEYVFAKSLIKYVIIHLLISVKVVSLMFVNNQSSSSIKIVK